MDFSLEKLTSSKDLVFGMAWGVEFINQVKPLQGKNVCFTKYNHVVYKLGFMEQYVSNIC